ELQIYINEPLHYLKYYRHNQPLQQYFASRFQFHLLSYGETYRALRETLSLVREHGAPGCNVMLTVSPVPIVGSFTGQDVLIANMYSKSVLRAVAGQLCAEFDFVDYFPSYEITMLSPDDATTDDGVHIKEEAVVDRMIEAYVR